MNVLPYRPQNAAVKLSCNKHLLKANSFHQKSRTSTLNMCLRMRQMSRLFALFQPRLWVLNGNHTCGWNVLCVNAEAIVA
jgi:hypothetical protein